ncbi:hypothetical protein [Phormidesmis sp. 146-35]
MQSLQPSSLTAQKDLRISFAEKILPDLRRIRRDRDEPPSPVYADSLIRTMREMRDPSSEDPFTQIVMALHNAMAFENHWITYTADQYLGAYTLLKSLVDQDNLQPEEVQQAILGLNRLGFETIPFDFNPSVSRDSNPQSSALALVQSLGDYE